MKIEPAVDTIAYNGFNIRLASSVRGTAVLTNHDFPFTPSFVDLPDVTSATYTDVLLQKYGIEYVGIIEVLSVTPVIRTRVNGDGSIRWQISGIGGGADSNWETFIEQSFNVGAFTNIDRQGCGQWITSINTGDDQLQIRLQALANSGTVNLKLSDLFSEVDISYRQKRN